MNRRASRGNIFVVLLVLASSAIAACGPGASCGPGEVPICNGMGTNCSCGTTCNGTQDCPIGKHCLVTLEGYNYCLEPEQYFGVCPSGTMECEHAVCLAGGGREVCANVCSSDSDCAGMGGCCSPFPIMWLGTTTTVEWACNSGRVNCGGRPPPADGGVRDGSADARTDTGPRG